MPINRSAPRISINQLTKYMVSTPSQRRKIIEAQKRPPAFLVNWYDVSKRAIVKFILNGCTDEGPLVLEIQRIRQLTPTSEYDESRNNTNCEAIEAFRQSYSQVNFAGLAAIQCPRATPTLNFSSVEVSVRPEIILTGQHRKRPVTGGIKLYFSKDDPLTAVSAPFAAALVQQYVHRHQTSPGSTARCQSCLVYDIFAGTCYSAPSAFTRRMQDIDAACQEISLWWQAV